MAKRDKNRNPNAEGPREPSVLEKLDAAESASVLKALVDHHPELRSEAEALAREVLGEVSLFSVADDVEDAVLQFDYDDLNSRAGSHSGGYVEPTEAAWELLEAAGNALEVLMSAAGGEGAPAGRKPRGLSSAFVRERIPDWEWALKPGSEDR